MTNQCYHCNYYVEEEEQCETVQHKGHEVDLCPDCIEAHTEVCEACRKQYYRDVMIMSPDRMHLWYCGECFHDTFFRCDHCLQNCQRSSFNECDGESVCSDCLEQK